jgi:Alcohol dehydrogenase GroES-like domain
MDYSEPFLFFVLFELACILALLAIWLDLGFSFLYVSLYCHASPELIGVLNPPEDEVLASPETSVQACGICHSDVLTKDGLWPGCNARECPGEIAGVIDIVGTGVEGWRARQHVGPRGSAGAHSG